MNNPKTVVLSILMYFVGVSHMIIGLAILVSPQLQQSVAAIYGAQVNWTPELTYVLRVLGAFMLALGGIGVMAARDPLSHPGIVIMFAALLTIRVLQRAVFSNDIQNLFAISSWRLWSTALIFLVLALALVGLLVVCRMDRLGGEAQKGPG